MPTIKIDGRDYDTDYHPVVESSVFAFRLGSGGLQAANGESIGLTVFPFSHAQNQNNEAIILHRIHQPVAGLGELDFVAILQISLEQTAWHAWHREFSSANQ